MSAADDETTAVRGAAAAPAWENVWEIFEEVVDMPAAERDAFLDRVCADRPSVRRAVEGMLDADKTTEGAFFDRPVLGDREETPGPTPRGIPAGIPKHFGPYTLQHKVGEGGMSSVFLALRDDDAYRRQVVVKIIRPGMETEHLVQRLRIERQILAGLDHPNIAHLLDGGSTPDGTPYFVMEYVDGVPVDTFCEHGELSVEERLRLFLKICAAVGFAHRNLVVHRDIKPSNILVNAEGEPKLLDFGIAKLLNPELGPSEIAPTITANRMMTPSYASPEQIRGRLVTTSSDVYSLGVLLYKMLTHTLPYDFTKRTAIEIEQLITGSEPRKPSQVATRQTTGSSSAHVDVAKVRRQLAGDLDAIILKALRSAPQQRYSGVDALAADIERYLDGLPVEARRGSRRYTIAKFFSRHRVAVSVTAGILLLSLYFMSALARQNARLEIERDQARTERDQKQQVLQLFEQWVFFAEPYVAPGEKLTMEDVVRRSMPIFEARLKDQPKVKAQLLHTTATMLERLGDLDTAHRQIERALKLRREAYGENSLEVAETLLVLSEVQSHGGRFDESLENAQNGLAMVDELLQQGSSYRLDVIRVRLLNQIVAVYCHRGDLQEAREPALEAATSSESLVGSADWVRLTSLDLMANWHNKVGDYKSAAVMQQQSIDLRRQLFGESHPSLIIPLSNMGLDLRWSGDLDGAERFYREARDLTRDVYGVEHQRYSIVLNNLAEARFARGDYTEALADYTEVSRLFLQAVGDAHWRNFFLTVATEAARLRTGEVDTAASRLQAAIEEWEPRLVKSPWVVHHARSVLGEARLLQGRTEEAETLLHDALTKLIEHDAKHRYLLQAVERLGLFLEAMDRADEIPTYEAMIETKSS